MGGGRVLGLTAEALGFPGRVLPGRLPRLTLVSTEGSDGASVGAPVGASASGPGETLPGLDGVPATSLSGRSAR
jgi:hypothetical protein